MLEMFNGENAKEVYQEISRTGFLHSAIPDPGSFMIGVCSAKEIELAQMALAPAERCIIKAHLIDVVQDADAGPALWLRSLDRQSTYQHPIERGSFLVDCTDHVSERSNTFQPIVSGDGLVLSPQLALGLPGPTAHLITHAWYLKVLDGFWQTLPRMPMQYGNKDAFGLQMLFAGMVSMGRMATHLPRSLVKETKSMNSGRPVRKDFLTRSVKVMPGIAMKFMSSMPLRYTDAEPYIASDADDILGGNIGRGRTGSSRSKL